MGIVIDMPPRRQPKGEMRTVLQEVLAQSDLGELHGAILITDTDEGTRFNALGACRERLQLGILTTIRGLFHMAEEVAASGTAGNTPATGPIAVNFPRRTLPKRLKEQSGFGDLEWGKPSL
jgi:hypothetical protein